MGAKDVEVLRRSIKAIEEIYLDTIMTIDSKLEEG